MKKILFFIGAFATLNASAQIYEANDEAAFSAWTPYDLDGDGFNWAATDVSWLTNTQTGQGGCATSESFDGASGAGLTPDNLFVSPIIDMSATAGGTLTFSIGNPEGTNNWWEEKYAVYVVTDPVAIATGIFPAPLLETTLTAGDTMFTESIDISSVAAGQSTVYLVFRHYDCTDENFIILDDLSITGAFASVGENTLIGVRAFPNPAVDVLNISTNEPVSSVKVTTLDGKIVVNNTSINSSFINLDLNELEAGMYVYEVATEEGKIFRDSFVKQ
ncbi:MAG: T9SS type A sorting domain-containing protein [Crocinitomicaceae bacterium]